MVDKQDGNDAGLAIAQEATIGELPVTPIWHELEVNSYTDMGGEPTLVQRAPIGTRKKRRGSITGIDPKAGFGFDFTKTNFYFGLQGFFFNPVNEAFTTQPLNDDAIVITAVATADDSYTAAAGLDAALVGDLILASNFDTAANNGLKNAATVAAGKITVTQNLANEAGPPADAKLVVVGHQFDAGDASLTYTAPASLVFAVDGFDLTTLNRQVGEWIYIGGDASAAMHFATATLRGFARIATIAEDGSEWTFDKVSFPPATDAGAAKTIQIFYGSVFRDATDEEGDERFTYTLERRLGRDADGIQGERVGGCVANELTVNSPKKDKLTFDIGYIGISSETFAGAEGLAAGTRIDDPGEDAFNTSSDVGRLRLSVFDGSTLLPVGFGYSTTATFKISNGATLDEAVGVVGGFEVSVGDFAVSGSAELFFTDVSAIEAVRNKLPTSLDEIVAMDNKGWIFDIPFVELGGGLAKVEKNKPIMLPLNANGAVCDAGYTILFNYFSYLPNAAMPSSVQT